MSNWKLRLGATGAADDFLTRSNVQSEPRPTQAPRTSRRNDNPYLVVLECTDAGGAEIGIAITQMGYRPLFLLNPDLYSADLTVSLQNFAYLVADTTSVCDVLALLDSIDRPVVGVTTLVDSRIPVAAEVAQKLGIPGPDPACMLLRDKAQVALWCPEVSPRAQIAGVEPSSTQDILDRWRRSFGDGPVVVKPRTGCGAVGVQILETEEHRRAFIQATPDLHAWLVQEYFVGSLYSIEGWVDGSGVHYVGWTSRRKIGNTETELRFEGFDALPSPLTRRAQLAVEQLFARSSFRRGWFHIEFLVNADRTQLRLIDANTGRTGGAMLPHVLAMALGVRPSDLYQHALQMQLWGRSTIELPETLRPVRIYKCICFGSPETVTLRDVRLPRPLGQAGSLRVTRILGGGDPVSEAGRDDWSWIGFVAGPEDEVDRYASHIEIHTDNAVLKAAF